MILRRRILTDGWLAVLIVVGAIVLDQLIKVSVKTSMTLHESIRVTDWFYISFIENNGMAYGMQIGSKLALSLFRVVAIALLAYYLCACQWCLQEPLVTSSIACSTV